MTTNDPSSTHAAEPPGDDSMEKRAVQGAPAPPSSPPPEQRGASGRRYVYAWLALLGLTALSFGVDRLHLGSISTGIALGVAVVKASIVFIVFMHLDREPFPIRFVAGLNVAWVLLLCLGIAADVGTLNPGN
jgi:cytochrome c oxidase subunit IV